MQSEHVNLTGKITATEKENTLHSMGILHTKNVEGTTFSGDIKVTAIQKT